MVSILDYSNEAKFNIKAVSLKTDIQAVTIRAWERRYALLEPQRGGNGYRLYSERDIALLTWVKKQVDGGISISSVAAELKTAIEKERWPEAVLTDKGPVASRHNRVHDNKTLAQQLATALLRSDERMAADIFGEALGNAQLIPLFEEILTPVLVEIGERWERGEISVATEHFASYLIQGKVEAIYHSLPLHPSGPKVMLGCAPDELHEIGSLMFATLLRDAGYRVEFLGPDLPLKDLAVYAGEEKPRLLIVAATILEPAYSLIEFPALLAKLKQQPVFAFGGAAFGREPGLSEKVAGIYLGATLAKSLAKVKSLVPLRGLS